MILLDTHIWIWWVNRSPQQTPQIVQHIQNHQQNGLGASLISCWEVAKLVETGKLQLTLPVADWLNQALAYPGVQLLDLTVPIVVERHSYQEPFIATRLIN
jgi:PIN domain nuclease of toxin-antitoxin system